VAKLPRLTADWEPEWLYLYWERAGIKEYDGKMDRARAEREAEREVREMAAKEKRCSR
jgi:hypothetical protein